MDSKSGGLMRCAGDRGAQRAEGELRLDAEPVDDRLAQRGLDGGGVPAAVACRAPRRRGRRCRRGRRSAASRTSPASSLSCPRASSAISSASSATKNGRTSAEASVRCAMRVWMSSATALSRPSSPSDGLPESTSSRSRNGSSREVKSPELELADVDAVEPVELLEVEDRADRVDLLPVEAVAELAEGEDLALGAVVLESPAGRPAARGS